MDHFIDGALVAGEGNVLSFRRASDSRIYAELPVDSAEMVDRAVIWNLAKCSRAKMKH